LLFIGIFLGSSKCIIPPPKKGKSGSYYLLVAVQKRAQMAFERAFRANPEKVALSTLGRQFPSFSYSGIYN